MGFFKRILAGAATFAAIGTVGAAPPEIEKWFEEVAARNPEISCPQNACVWSGPLSIKNEDSHMSFSVEVRNASLAPARILLPGGASGRPYMIKIDGSEAGTISGPEGQWVVVKPGVSKIEGQLPKSEGILEVPDWVGVGYSRKSETIIELPFGNKQSDISIPKKTKGGGVAKIRRVLEDGQGWTLRTTIEGEWNGKSSGIRVKGLVPEGFEVFAATSSAKLKQESEDGAWLIVPARPGKFRADFSSWGSHSAKMTSQTMVEGVDEWSGSETWFIKRAEHLRGVEFSCRQIDPRRLDVPETLKGLQACEKKPAENIEWKEISRNEAAKTVRATTLSFLRGVWVGFDGTWATVADRGAIESPRGVRVEAPDGVRIKEGEVGGELVQLTENEGKTGFSVPGGEQSFMAVAKADISKWNIELPAAPKIKSEANDIRAAGEWSLHLPNGWRLISAHGGVESSGWAGMFSLYSLFFCALCGLGAWKVWGWRVGALTGAAMVTASLFDGLPYGVWAGVVAFGAVAVHGGDSTPGVWGKRGLVFFSLITAVLLALFTFNRLMILLHPGLYFDAQPGGAGMLGWGGSPTNWLKGESWSMGGSDALHSGFAEALPFIQVMFVAAAIYMGIKALRTLIKESAAKGKAALYGIAALLLISLPSLISTSASSVFSGPVPQEASAPRSPSIGLGGIAAPLRSQAPMMSKSASEAEIMNAQADSFEMPKEAAKKKTEIYETRTEISEGVPIWRGVSWSLSVKEGTTDNVSLWVVPAWASRILALLLGAMAWILWWKTMPKDFFQRKLAEAKIIGEAK